MRLDEYFSGKLDNLFYPFAIWKRGLSEDRDIFLTVSENYGGLALAILNFQSWQKESINDRKILGKEFILSSAISAICTLS